jgi:hypothetical protein
MTREQILSLENYDLDIAVAKYVMKFAGPFSLTVPGLGTAWGRRYFIPYKSELAGVAEYLGNKITAWQPHKDAAAAIEVADEMNKQSYMCGMLNKDGTWSVGFDLKAENRIRHSAEHRSFSTAICRAALLRLLEDGAIMA